MLHARRRLVDFLKNRLQKTFELDHDLTVMWIERPRSLLPVITKRDECGEYAGGHI
ncbi:hypothetical protein HFO58_34800 [Rhizobium leguminosarum]|uniref:cellulose synthase operon protein YhjQ/BcsQ n=1 Tax=Rhizobium leguminosarum TaxID=384 RepID=UPI001C97CE5F|nr:hypothetical protein [Rhizobium leguminosarum]